MTAFILSSGQERSFALRAGDSLAVLSGGTSSDSTVGGRAIETVMAGGRSFVDQIQSGGEIDLQSGALLQGGTVSSGGVLSLAQGANADPAVISAGGLVEGAGVLGYPDGYVSDYGVISGVAVEDDNNGLAITVSDGGSIEAATLYDGLVVLSSASASGTKVDGGSLVIDAGGSASSTVVSAYGQQDVYAGGRDIGTVVSHGGAEVVLSGGVASDVTVLRGGVLALERGARILKSVVSSGGELAFGFVSSGQVVSAGIVLTKSEVVSGVTLAAGATTGLDGDTTVQSGGLVKIGSSGLADDYVIVSEGGRIDGAGPLTKATFVWDYGVVSGVALGAAGEGGASLSVGSNGIANAITIMSGGMSLMDDDTRASGTVVEGSHASLTIWAGRATDTRVSSGGFVSSYEGAFLSNLDVIAGGIVSGQGTVTGIARDAGVLWDASIGSDAVLHVSSGGAVTGYAYVYGGAEVFLSAGATARELEVKSGAKVVDDGELDYQDGAGIPFAGTLLGTGVILESGVGTVVVSGDASAFRGEVVVDGGTVLLADMGGLGRATVGFVSAKYPSELQLDSAATPVSGTSILTVLSNFSTTSDELDLTGVSYTSGASAKVADGVLTLRDGAYRTRVKLAGAISSAYVVMADSSGGTLITAAASAGTLVEAAAGFEARFPGRSGVDEMAPPLLSESLVGGHAAHLRQA